MEFSLQQIAIMLGGQVEGDATLKVSSLGRIQEARRGQIAFLANPKYEQYLYSTQATAVIINRDFELKKPSKTMRAISAAALVCLFSIITAIAILGSLTGAKAINHE